MVSETVRRELQAALQEANDERHAAQAAATDADSLVVDARGNLQRAEAESALAEEQHNQSSQSYRALLDYYNGLPDKTGLEGINKRLMTLSAQANERLHAMQDCRAIVSRRRDELQTAEARLALAKRLASTAERNWADLAAQVDRAHAA